MRRFGGYGGHGGHVSSHAREKIVSKRRFAGSQKILPMSGWNMATIATIATMRALLTHP
jgi:hypothetical protein